MKKYSLVHYPFNISNNDQAMLVKTPGGFELHFEKSIFTKKVTSTLNSGIKNYIEIEIENGKCKLLNETDKIHEFTTPADFYVDINHESKEFYTNIHNRIISDDLESLTEYASEFNEYVKHNNLPEHPVPSITTSSHFENFKVNSTSRSETEPVYSLQIHFGDPVPTKPSPKIENDFLQELGDEKFIIQKNCLSSFFNENKIVKAKQIEKAYHKNITKEQKNKLKYTSLKKSLLLHAYFYNSGPWRHCWIQIRYDPATDPQNYKYQTLYQKRTQAPFQLIEYPKIIEEVEKRSHWFLLNECNPTDGFISEALRDLISYMLSKEYDI